MPDEITDQSKLTNVRLSFPDIFDAKAVQEGGEPKFGCSFLIDKEAGADQIKALKALIVLLAVSKLFPKAEDGREKVVEMIKKKKLKICLHEGSEKEYDGYTEENMYLTASSSKRPLIIDRDRSPLTKEDGRPYAGCFVNAKIRLWVQDNNFGKRVNAELKGIQFFKDGEPFGSDAPATPEDFEDLSEPGEKPGKKAGKTKSTGKEDPDEESSADEEEF